MSRKLLLHICCAPCATYVHKWLKENDFSVTGFFYNPNIQPSEEYQRREGTLRMYAAMLELKLIHRGKDQTQQFERSLGEDRCLNCYKERLYQTASFAKRSGFEYFTTTLLISPYQEHEQIIEAGELTAKKFGINFFYEDFRKGYYESRKMAKLMNLYRQKYCGCAESQKERRPYDEQITQIT